MKNAERKICFAKEIRKRIRRFFQNPACNFLKSRISRRRADHTGRRPGGSPILYITLYNISNINISTPTPV